MINTFFMIIDISILAVLLGLLIFFLVKNKKNLSKDGVLYLYKTSWGLKLIDKIGNKYKKTLGVLSYISVFTGYVLMALILYLLGSQTFQYLTNPAIVELIKAPPIAPLIPYFPQIFGFGDLFPPFYAVYFIISILIVATIHEFSHGVFAKRWGVKIKSTGFAFFKFFPAFFGAFVEQDDKQLTKKSKFKQMSILSAGVFANILTAILFLILLGLFFSAAFVPAGVAFSGYSYSIVPTNSITMINNISLSNPGAEDILLLIKNDSLNEINVGEIMYVGIKGFSSNKSFVGLYDNAPAINFKEDEIILGKNPTNESLPFLGVLMTADQNSNGLGKRISTLLFFKNSNIYYESRIGAAGEFIYYLLWWVFLINILVGLFNMLPLGILDGGRFFYLTMLGLAK